MPLSITEVFGYSPADMSAEAALQRQSEQCPFTRRRCWKTFRSGDVIHGTCTAKPPTSEEVIVCPQRLYARDYAVLADVTKVAFGPGAHLIPATELQDSHGSQNRVVAFGRDWGGEGCRVRHLTRGIMQWTGYWP